MAEKSWWLTVWYHEYDQGGETAVHGRFEELGLAEEEVAESWLIEPGVDDTVALLYVLVKDSKRQNRHGRVEKVVDSDKHGVEQSLWRKRAQATPKTVSENQHPGYCLA